MPNDLIPTIRLCPEPDRMVVVVSQEDELPTDLMAEWAVSIARKLMPKVTGHLAQTIREMSGPSWFGIYFPDRRAWFQEQGTRPFTMRNLAGKTIPMWVDKVDDATKRNPKTKVRRTVDGRTQYLIFRRVAERGQRRNVIRRGAGGTSRVASVPMSYPGAAGRITKREASKPLTTAGRVGGRIASGNVGVRWRHPGIVGHQFMAEAMTQTAVDFGIRSEEIFLADDASFFSLVRGLA